MISVRSGLTKSGDMAVLIDGDNDRHFDFAAPIEDIEKFARNILQACDEARQLLSERHTRNAQ